MGGYVQSDLYYPLQPFYHLWIQIKCEPCKTAKYDGFLLQMRNQRCLNLKISGNITPIRPAAASHQSGWIFIVTYSATKVALHVSMYYVPSRTDPTQKYFCSKNKSCCLSSSISWKLSAGNVILNTTTMTQLEMRMTHIFDNEILRFSRTTWTKHARKKRRQNCNKRKWGRSIHDHSVRALNLKLEKFILVKWKYLWLRCCELIHTFACIHAIAIGEKIYKMNVHLIWRMGTGVCFELYGLCVCKDDKM